jgi:hypothetical protein
MDEEAHMSRIAALFVGVVALAVISTVAEAEDGCGRGWYYNGRRCVPQDEPSYYPPQYRVLPQEEPGYYYRPQYRRDYEPPVERGPQMRFDLRDEEARYTPPNPNFKTLKQLPAELHRSDGLCKPYRGR